MINQKITISVSGMNRVDIFTKLVNRKIVLFPLFFVFGVEQTINILTKICEKLIKIEVVK